MLIIFNPKGELKNAKDIIKIILKEKKYQFFNNLNGKIVKGNIEKKQIKSDIKC